MGDAPNPFSDDPIFRRFFGDQSGPENGGRGSENGGRRGRMKGMPAPKQQGVGSGVIVSKDGYILTNNHVVENAEEVKVQIGDQGDEIVAKVVGTDPKADIAVLKIDAKDKSFSALTVADSDKLEVGDVVLAVGNPFGIGQTVTMGIVSATGRATLGLEYEDFIQTDAAINMGNSGGALVDAEGRLVGINTAILSRTGGNQGIGFAVPGEPRSLRDGKHHRKRSRGPRIHGCEHPGCHLDTRREISTSRNAPARSSRTSTRRVQLIRPASRTVT
jgi:serine protease Do